MEIFIQFFNFIKKAILSVFDYKNRSDRREYFCWYLFVVLCSFIIGIIIGFIMEFIDILGEIILSLFLILVFLVSLPLGIRRLHDIGKTPWFILIGLIPFAGPIILLVFFCKNSKEEINKLGESKKNHLYEMEEFNISKPIKNT
jgi:uncharacterized membrane protein YhaH (DUF805 family)